MTLINYLSAIIMTIVTYYQKTFNWLNLIFVDINNVIGLRRSFQSCFNSENSLNVYKEEEKLEKRKESWR